MGGNIGVPVALGTKVGVEVSVGVTVGGIGVFVGKGVDVAVGMALCVSAKTVLTVDMAVSIISASLSVGVDWKLLQDASMIAARTKEINGLPKMFMFHRL